MNKILALAIILTISTASVFIIWQWMNPLTIQDTSPKEALQIADAEIYYGSGFTSAQASVLMYNSENVPATITKITIRGKICDWSDVYYWKGELGSVATLDHASTELNGTSFKALIDGSERTFQQATGEIVLEAYKTIVFYINNAGDITSENAPSGNVTMAVYTEKAVFMYQAPVKIDIVIPFMGSEEVKITNVQFASDLSQATLTVKNTGSAAVTISEAYQGSNGGELATAITLQPGETDNTIVVDGPYNPGTSYQFKVVSQKGNPFVYTMTAPSV